MVSGGEWRLALLGMQLMADSESEVWMMTGLAVRMSIDLGLHLVSDRIGFFS